MVEVEETLTDFAFGLKESLEFAINVGCPLNCKTYCPQDALLRAYNGPKIMTLATFNEIQRTVPKEVGRIFAGVSEPFLNPDLVEMVLATAKQGSPLTLFTTLLNATPEDIDRLKHVDFANFCLHEPDPVHCKIPYSEQLGKTHHKVYDTIPSANSMSMNDWFISTNGREYLSRGLRPKRKRWGFCHKLSTPQMMVYPSGDVYLCCTDFALEHRIGNLFIENYGQIRSRMLHEQPYELCHYCRFFLSARRRIIAILANWGRVHVLHQRKGTWLQKNE